MTPRVATIRFSARVPPSGWNPYHPSIPRGNGTNERASERQADGSDVDEALGICARRGRSTARINARDFSGSSLSEESSSVPWWQIPGFYALGKSVRGVATASAHPLAPSWYRKYIVIIVQWIPISFLSSPFFLSRLLSHIIVPLRSWEFARKLDVASRAISWSCWSIDENHKR